jgi:hypothetical protein
LNIQKLPFPDIPAFSEPYKIPDEQGGISRQSIVVDSPWPDGRNHYTPAEKTNRGGIRRIRIVTETPAC